MGLIKSKDRVQKHGEVFTPAWMVRQMLASPSIQEKVMDMHATFLEPSAGEGAFLVEILRQRLDFVGRLEASRGGHLKYNVLWALASIYGIEYLEDNLAVARAAMLRVFKEYYEQKTGRELPEDADIYLSAKFLIEKNIVQGNTLTHLKKDGTPIRFSEWRQDEKKHQTVTRHEFAYDELFQKEDTGEVLTLTIENEGAAIAGPIDLLKVWQL